jgi:hypothetical protein
MSLAHSEFIERKARLAAPFTAIRLRVFCCMFGVTVEYLATPAQLIAARCGPAEAFVLDRRGRYHEGKSAGGHTHYVHKAPNGKARLHWRMPPDVALQMPGVRELFPDGLPEFEEEQEERRFARTLPTAGKTSARPRLRIVASNPHVRRGEFSDLFRPQLALIQGGAA